MNFKHVELDYVTIYVGKDEKTYMVVYLNDSIIIDNNKKYTMTMKEELKKGLEIIDLG